MNGEIFSELSRTPLLNLSNLLGKWLQIAPLAAQPGSSKVCSTSDTFGMTFCEILSPGHMTRHSNETCTPRLSLSLGLSVPVFPQFFIAGGGSSPPTNGRRRFLTRSRPSSSKRTCLLHLSLCDFSMSNLFALFSI